MSQQIANIAPFGADIFGGTFDPVQLGHIAVIRRELSPHRVLVVAPTSQNPWKDRVATPMEDRLEMLRRVLNWEIIPFTEGQPKLGAVYLCERKYERSVELLHWWRQNFGTDIRWLVGPGEKELTAKWLNWDKEGCEVIESSSDYPFHSTDIREKRASPHPALVDFIREKGLYA